MKTAKEVAWKMVLFFKDHGAKFENLANTNDLVSKEFTSFAAAQVELEKVNAAIRCEKVIEERVKKAIKFAKDNLATPENVKVVQEALDKARAEGFKEGVEQGRKETLQACSNSVLVQANKEKAFKEGWEARQRKDIEIAKQYGPSEGDVVNQLSALTPPGKKEESEVLYRGQCRCAGSRS